jgi:hypothetical protein
MDSKYHAFFYHCTSNKSLIAFPASSLMQMDLAAISLGAAASPRFKQAYVAFGFCAVILQNENLMIPGVLYLLRTIKFQ